MGYVPERGDVIWLEFNPQAGHEQAGHRPALVVSLAAYNGKTSLALVCPITTQVKGYPFEVEIPDGLPVAGVILADRSNAWIGASGRPKPCAHCRQKSSAK